ncbi:MAG TPA: MFS transporter, partial [Gammaproteobacteria bacterium]|nr:MFS transporter [Gammaproteobacteria bacterium]
MSPLNLIIPAGVAPEMKLLFLARALRALCDGYVAILLPAYLLALGLGTLEVGLISTATLLGSATLTLTVGAWGYRFHHRVLLLAAATLMMLTGFGLAGLSSFWPLLLVAFVGTINPSSGDVSVFLPLEHARIAEAAQGDERTKVFARYSLIGALFAAVGALAAGLPDVMVGQGMDNLMALRLMFVFYGCTGIIVWWLYQRIPEPPPHEQPAPPQPLGESRKTVFKLAALFSVDAFAGGFIVNTLLSLWLFQKFNLSLASAGHFFFWAGLFTAFSQLAAPWVAKRIGLLNTMVFTHIPASILLIIAAFTPSLFWVLVLLLVRALLSQMDVPTRSA